jgi:membrane associated rhomboid family serine protease
MLNVPPIVTVTIAVMALVHAVRVFVLTPRGDIQFLLLFSFIPARYDPTLATQSGLPNGWGAQIWTFVTYGLIHGDLTHLAINTIWLLAFGSAVARRFGAWRFLAFSAVTAAAGAALHLATHPGDFWPMVGASAAISGFMAAAIRFVFQAGGPLGLLGGSRGEAYAVPAAPLLVTLRDPRVIAFLAVWFGLNILFGLGSLSLTDDQQSVAWQAHIGGFVAGLVLFPLFDPVTRIRAGHDDAGGSGRQTASH